MIFHFKKIIIFIATISTFGFFGTRSPTADARSVILPVDKTVPICKNCRFFIPERSMCSKFRKVDMITGTVKSEVTSCCICRDRNDLCGRDGKFYEPVDVTLHNISEQLFMINYLISNHPSMKTLGTSIQVYELYSSIMKILNGGVPTIPPHH